MNRLYPKHRKPSDHCKNALKYCPRPQEAQTSFDRSPKNKSGECRREFLNQTPSNLQKPLGDCAKSRRDIKSRETLCILEVSAPALGPQTHTHTLVSVGVCVITALLVDASSFPQQPKRKLERNIRRSLPRPGCFLLYNVEFICKQSCATGQENSPLLFSFVHLLSVQRTSRGRGGPSVPWCPRWLLSSF